jgi:TolB-like protein
VPDIRERLQRRLGQSYAIERELGGGGMSRIFLARETALGRDVVVKVLPPELGDGLSLERFAREVRLASRLTHPCIVPVLAVGDVDGLPYYTMPYIRGESLRRSLAAGPLPVPLALRVLRDVLRALSYAHHEGVVHRDIKPGNVLLAGDGALVTDFGIARAIETGRAGESIVEVRPPTVLLDENTDDRRDAAVATLTSTGIVIGTPGYMAPEQLFGDPTADHRIDLYAVGALAFELLTGYMPFAGLASGARLAAALAGPPSVRAARAETPMALATLIERCLATTPDDRPSSADDVLEALDRVPAAEGPPTPSAAPAVPARIRRWTQRRIGGAIAAGALLVGGLVAWRPLSAVFPTLRVLATRGAPTLAPHRLVVAPFEDMTGDPTLVALGDLVADQLAEALTRVPGLEVVDARTASVSGEVVRRIPWPLRARDAARALAEETGAGLVLRGTIRRDGDSLRARATIVDVGTERVRQALAVMAGPAARPTLLVDVVRRRVVASLTQGTDTVLRFALGAVSPPPSLEAYRAMREGLRAYLAMDVRASDLLRKAAAIDTSYVTPLVLLALLEAMGGGMGGDFIAGDSALRALTPRLELLSPAEAAVVEVARAMVRHDADAAVAAAEELVRRTPGSAEAPLLAATLANHVRQPRRALAALARTDPDRGLNLGSPYYFLYRSEAWRLLGERERALADLREVERRFPSQAWIAIHARTLLFAEAGRTEDAVTHVDAFSRQLGGAYYPYLDEAVAVALHGGHRATAGRLVAPFLPAALATARRRGTSILELEHSTAIALFAATGRWAELRDVVLRWRRSLAVRGTTSTERQWDRQKLTFLYAAAANLRDSALAARVDSALSAGGREPPGSGAMRRAIFAAAVGRRDEAVSWLVGARGEGYGQTTEDGEAFERKIALAPLFGYPPFERLLATRDPAPRVR